MSDSQGLVDDLQKEALERVNINNLPTLGRYERREFEKQVQQLRARIAELEALYKPDCTTCARYHEEAGCEWVECYGNGHNCYLAKDGK
jgi:hypothetical protein